MRAIVSLMISCVLIFLYCLMISCFAGLRPIFPLRVSVNRDLFWVETSMIWNFIRLIRCVSILSSKYSFRMRFSFLNDQISKLTSCWCLSMLLMTKLRCLMIPSRKKFLSK